MRVNMIINVHLNLMLVVATAGFAWFACRTVDVTRNNVEYSTIVPQSAFDFGAVSDFAA